MDYTVGQLAQLSGVTVRALHHYEKLGLLPPSGRTEAGYRRYTERDVQRLHRILACQQIGMALKDIAPYLAANAPPLHTLLQSQATVLEAEIERRQRLLSMLKRLASDTTTGGEPASTDQLLELMTAMQTLDRHYSADEQKQLLALRDGLAPDDRQAMKQELLTLLQGFNQAMANATAPTDAEVKGLARRWMALAALRPAPGNLREKTRALIDSQPEVQRATGITPALKGYIDQAIAAAGLR